MGRSTKKSTYTSQYLCKHVGIWVNLSLARISASREHDFGLSLFRVRYQRFENCLDDEPRVETPIRRSLIDGSCFVPMLILTLLIEIAEHFSFWTTLPPSPQTQKNCFLLRGLFYFLLSFFFSLRR